MLEPIQNHRAEATIRNEIEAMTSFLATPGWRLLLESLSRNKEIAVAQICEDKQMSEVEMAYQRATIRAIDRMMKHPSIILEQLQTELLMTTKGKTDGTK